MPPVVVRVLLTYATGSVGVMEFTVDDGRGLRQEPTAANIQAVIDRTNWGPLLKSVTSWRLMDPREGHGPADRTFRGAWRDAGSTIRVDMPAAREIHRQRMRYAREPILLALDVAYQRAGEAAPGMLDADHELAQADVVSRKQQLRDVTDDPAIDAAQTPDELKAVWPACLGARPRV